MIAQLRALSTRWTSSGLSWETATAAAAAATAVLVAAAAGGEGGSHRKRAKHSSTCDEQAQQQEFGASTAHNSSDMKIASGEAAAVPATATSSAEPVAPASSAARTMSDRPAHAATATVMELSSPHKSCHERPAASNAAATAELSSLQAFHGAHALGTAAAVAPASSSMTDKMQEVFSNRPCRACTSTQDLFAAFSKQVGKHSNSGSSGSGLNSGTSDGGSAATGAAQHGQEEQSDELGTAASSSSGDSSSGVHSSGDSSSGAHSSGGPSPWGEWEEEAPCPPDILDLGRASWMMLHSIAAYYPESPSPELQERTRTFIDALGDLYPCLECAAHLRRELQQKPPDVSSGAGLSAWMCRLHNEVNVRLGKPMFDCARVQERWRDGPADGSCWTPRR